jgi:hypothetical protein
MPSAFEIHSLFRNFTGEEWLQLLVELLETYNFSHEELSLIRDNGDRHIERLQQVLAMVPLDSTR